MTNEKVKARKESWFTACCEELQCINKYEVLYPGYSTTASGTTLHPHLRAAIKHSSWFKVKGGRNILGVRDAPRVEQLVAIWRPLGGLLDCLSSETHNPKSTAGTGFVRDIISM